MVQVAIGWRGQLEGAEADVIEGLIVNAEGLIRVFHKLATQYELVLRFEFFYLVHRECCVVGLHHCV